MANHFLKLKTIRTLALVGMGLMGACGSWAPAQSLTSSPVPTPWFSTFGQGPVEIRLYTDFFCGPCRAEEPEVAALLAQLVDRKAARVTFVDYPGHSNSTLYAVYFLAALNARGAGDIHRALGLRAALYEAAGSKVEGHPALEGFLKQKGIPFRPLDYRPMFKTFENWIVADKVLETPSCTIINDQGKQTLSGKSHILKALQRLAKG